MDHEHDYGETHRLAASLANRLYSRWSPEQREDLVQEVMIKYVRAFPGAMAPENPEAWLTTVIRNTAVNINEAQQRRPQAARPAAAGEDPVELLFSQAASQFTSLPAVSRELVDSFLALVPPDDAEIIRARHLDKRSAAEVAEELGIGRAAVDQRTSRAVRRLREAAGARPDLVEELRQSHPRVYPTD
jgi:RNA polymerase sigma-70 factor (ECF subfamily)